MTGKPNYRHPVSHVVALRRQASTGTGHSGPSMDAVAAACHGFRATAFVPRLSCLGFRVPRFLCLGFRLGFRV
jgi:hypothetical protein